MQRWQSLGLLWKSTGGPCPSQCPEMARSCGYPTPALRSKHSQNLPGVQTLAQSGQLGQTPPAELFSSESLPECCYFWPRVTVIDCWWKGIKAVARPHGLPDSSGRLSLWIAAQWTEAWHIVLAVLLTAIWLRTPAPTPRP